MSEVLSNVVDVSFTIITGCVTILFILLLIKVISWMFE